MWPRGEQPTKQGQMALIGVISDEPEIVMALDVALNGYGHTVSRLGAGDSTGWLAGTVPDLFVVDLDPDPATAMSHIRRLIEDDATALTPVLVTGTPEQAVALAGVCALGAAGYLRKPFTSVEARSATERALLTALPAL